MTLAPFTVMPSPVHLVFKLKWSVGANDNDNNNNNNNNNNYAG
jgi:hypothetical protein